MIWNPLSGMWDEKWKKNWDETASTSACAMCGTLKKVHYWFAKEKKKQKRRKKDIVELKYKKRKFFFQSLLYFPSLNLTSINCYGYDHSAIHFTITITPFFSHWCLTNKKKAIFLYFFFFLFCTAYISYPLPL